jgi:hypothetical protein
MKTQRMKVIFSTLAILALVAGSSTNAKAQDPLPSWNDGPAKQAIVDFVRTTTENGGAKFVPPEERIATLTRTARCGSSTRSTAEPFPAKPHQKVPATRKRTPIQTLGA